MGFNLCRAKTFFPALVTSEIDHSSLLKIVQMSEREGKRQRVREKKNASKRGERERERQRKINVITHD